MGCPIKCIFARFCKATNAIECNVGRNSAFCAHMARLPCGCGSILLTRCVGLTRMKVELHLESLTPDCRMRLEVQSVQDSCWTHRNREHRANGITMKLSLKGSTQAEAGPEGPSPQPAEIASDDRSVILSPSFFSVLQHLDCHKTWIKGIRSHLRDRI